MSAEKLQMLAVASAAAEQPSSQTSNPPSLTSEQGQGVRPGKATGSEKSRKQVNPKKAAQPYTRRSDGRKGTKKPSKELTLGERVDLIKTYELQRCSFRLLCQKYGVSMGTVHNVLKRKLLYLEMYNKELEKNKLQRVTYSPALIETHLFQWYQSMNSSSVAVTKEGVKQKAAELANAVGMPLYAVSDQWLDNFIERYNVDCANLKAPVTNNLVKKTGRRRKRKPTPCSTPVSMVPREDVTLVSSVASKEVDASHTAENSDESIEQQIYQFADTSSFQDVNSDNVPTVKAEPAEDLDYYQNMDMYEWHPPTEAEMKIMQARRERSDKISKVMGDYMLKGYKMLGTVCVECNTILLQDRDGRDYCVACNDLASDVSKDDPAQSTEAARRQAEEHQTSPASLVSPSTHQGAESTSDRLAFVGQRSQAQDTAVESTDTLHIDSLPPRIAEIFHANATSDTQRRTPIVVTLNNSPDTHCPITSTSTSVDIDEAVEVVQKKMRWATTELDRACSVEASAHTCQLIKVCAETLEVLHRIQTRSASQKPSD